MGLFGNKEKNYDTEIALLNEKTEENKNSVIALGLDFTNFKSSIGEQFSDVLEAYKRVISELSELKKWKESQIQETKATEKAKTELPDTLTYKEICDSLDGFAYLDQTSFKYYLYEQGILGLKINRIRNTYKLSENFANTTSEIKEYIHVTDGAITFDKGILDFLLKNSGGLQHSIDRYIRKQKQFNESKQHLSEAEIKNLQKEIGLICGVDSGESKNIILKNGE